jgi:hypothetical protein
MSMRISSDIASNQTFYTDLNGFQVFIHLTIPPGGKRHL